MENIFYNLGSSIEECLGFKIYSMLLFIVIILILFLLLHYIKVSKKENRISSYSVESIKNKRPSLFETMENSLKKFINNITKFLNKIPYINKYSKKYDKYKQIIISDDNTDIISIKIIVMLIFLITVLISSLVNNINIFYILFGLVIIYLIPDIVLYLYYKRYEKKLGEELLNAIIVMNNSFKTGKSILQAINIVADTMTGSISIEFKRMYMELSLGVSIEEVFKRFSKRVDLEEANYLTASIMALSKTGGNIIRVFEIMEKSFYDKKKLHLELKSLTSGSKLLIYTLTVLPFIFILLITFINPTYFIPFYTTTLGLLLTSLVIILYILYVIIIRKIIRIRV